MLEVRLYGFPNVLIWMITNKRYAKLCLIYLMVQGICAKFFDTNGDILEEFADIMPRDGAYQKFFEDFRDNPRTFQETFNSNDLDAFKSFFGEQADLSAAKYARNNPGQIIDFVSGDLDFHGRAPIGGGNTAASSLDLRGYLHNEYINGRLDLGDIDQVRNVYQNGPRFEQVDSRFPGSRISDDLALVVDDVRTAARNAADQAGTLGSSEIRSYVRGLQNTILREGSELVDALTDSIRNSPVAEALSESNLLRRLPFSFLLTGVFLAATLEEAQASENPREATERALVVFAFEE